MTNVSVARADGRAVYGRRPRPPAALRELLEATLDWAGAGGAPRVLESGGVRYRLMHLADGAAGAAAVLCEAPPGARIPDYGARRGIRAKTGDAAGRQLMIFTDAAHTTLVWSWSARGQAGIRTYRELSFRPGEAWGPLRPVLESIAAGSGAVATGARALGGSAADLAAEGVRDPAAPDAAALLAALSAALSADAGGTYRARLQALQDGIERLPTARDIRAGWSLLLELRAVDHACGEGAWLESALRAFATAYDALLERMRSEVDDLDRQRPRPRAERLGDLRRLVRRAGPCRNAAPSSRFATELAMLRNVFGEDADFGRVGRCRTRLAAAIGPAVPVGMVEMNVRARTLTRDSLEPPEVVRRGVAAILDAHLRTEIDPAELGRAMAAAARLLLRGSGVLPPPGRIIERARGRP